MVSFSLRVRWVDLGRGHGLFILFSPSAPAAQRP
jgi:hypothetical protein